MKKSIAFMLMLLLTCAASLRPATIFAQAGRSGPQASAATNQDSSKTESRTASALYQEAADYAQNKFKVFDEKKVPFDPKLLEQTLQEQRLMAARYAALIAARPALAGEDFYFLGMLYNMADDAQGTLDALKKYLADRKSTRLNSSHIL